MSASEKIQTNGVVALFEAKQYSRTVAGNILKAEQWSELSNFDDMLKHVNELYSQAEIEIEQAKKQGYATGYTEGLQQVEKTMTEQLASLNEKRARVLAEASGRIAELACAIVARIAPHFDPKDIVPNLVMQSVEAAQAEQFLLIRVHPSMRETITTSIGAIRQSHPAVGVIELVDDPSLDALSCVVVSEAGEVRASVAQQIEAIRAALVGVGRGHNQ